MSKEHIYAEFLAHYHVYKVFNDYPLLQRIPKLNQYYEKAKIAELNIYEDRELVKFLMAYEMYGY